MFFRCQAIPRQTTSAIIHKIRLQEILVAVHRVYLEPEGPIYNSIIDVINSPIDLKEALNSSALNYHTANQSIGEALKNIISKIVDFMVRILYSTLLMIEFSVSREMEFLV